MAIDGVDYTDAERDAAQEQAGGEPDKTHVHKLVDDVKSDLTDRGEWAERVKKNRELRFKTKATAKPAYPGAPNIGEPLIDDLIKEVRDQQVSMLFSSAVLANFIPVTSEGVGSADLAERVFDDHLRHFGDTRALIEACFDNKLCDGMGVAKMLPERTDSGDEIPHFLTVDPLDVVVPTATRKLKRSDRVCHILNYTKGEFDAAVKENGWDAEAAKSVREAIAEKTGKGTAGNGNSSGTDETGSGRAEWRDSKLSESHGFVTVWEIYYRREGRRYVCAVSPDYPQYPLKDVLWEYAPIVTGVRPVVDPMTGAPAYDPATGEPVMEAVEEPRPERQWPFYQFRNEGRSLGYYDTRGIGELTEQDQKEASGFRTARLIAADFGTKPFMTGSKKPEMFKFRAGEWAGDMEIKFFSPPANSMIYQSDYARTQSVRRVGGASGAQSSSDSGRDRKTATEVATVQQQASGASANEVDRSAEPLADLFGSIWFDLSWAARLSGRAPELSVGAAVAGNAGDLMEVFRHRYIVACGLSGRSANSMMQLQQLATVGDFAKTFPGIMNFCKGYDLAKLIFGSINPAWARQVLVDPKQAGQAGGAPIEQQVAQLGMQFQELSKVAENQNAYLASIAEADSNGDGIPDAQQAGGGAE